MTEPEKIEATTTVDGQEKRGSRMVEWPTSLQEIKDGKGPWESIQEFFEDACAHKTVKIQSEIRAELTGKNGKVKSGKVQFTA